MDPDRPVSRLVLDVEGDGLIRDLGGRELKGDEDPRAADVHVEQLQPVDRGAVDCGAEDQLSRDRVLLFRLAVR